MFDRFSSAFPAEAEHHADASVLTNIIEQQLHVAVPPELAAFWKEKGSGYFGDRILYFFGDGRVELARDSLQEWNVKDFWRMVYPLPEEGGPVFFAETCFGDQLGFRWEDGKCIFILFCVDTFDAFALCSGADHLFENVLTDRHALVDEERYEAISQALGPLRAGMHYAPLVSPLVGGGGNVENFCFETPNVHFRTAIATFQSMAAEAGSA